MAAGACQCWRMVASWRSAAPLGASNNARVRALVESQEADETTRLRKTANFHLFPNALVFVKILCCAFADALLLRV